MVESQDAPPLSRSKLLALCSNACCLFETLLNFFQHKKVFQTTNRLKNSLFLLSMDVGVSTLTNILYLLWTSQRLVQTTHVNPLWCAQHLPRPLRRHSCCDRHMLSGDTLPESDYLEMTSWFITPFSKF